ncbi:hypothetical protein CLAFUW4_14339 [Fulvia fulva]|uniref:Uncharacterized protein n=1 Tax=Passalora fulva TaxID=5499 RepID=A0A9Q8UWP5_PASFU|nr:uncharacterized protein CLAFUR5_14169 [Fulvia fulva]UJO25210.1 hypothetical protein CLAFUR5_14169 [Fulvia fulva]WPV22522.1 hypothetical protein CLAFUW4_14339 [Fulvia fulva]
MALSFQKCKSESGQVCGGLSQVLQRSNPRRQHTPTNDYNLRRERDFLSGEVQALEAAREATSSAWIKQISMLEEALGNYADDTVSESTAGDESRAGAIVVENQSGEDNRFPQLAIEQTSSATSSGSAPQDGNTSPEGTSQGLAHLCRQLDAYLEGASAKCKLEQNVVLRDQLQDETQVLQCSLERIQELFSILYKASSKPEAAAQPHVDALRATALR